MQYFCRSFKSIRLASPVDSSKKVLLMSSIEVIIILVYNNLMLFFVSSLNSTRNRQRGKHGKFHYILSRVCEPGNIVEIISQRNEISY